MKHSPHPHTALCSTGAFDLLVYTKKDVAAPEAWADSAPCFINNCQEVRLKSFSTSVHQVKAAVAYKLET